MGESAVPMPESRTQILVRGLGGWLLVLSSSVDGWGEVLSLTPLPASAGPLAHDRPSTTGPPASLPVAAPRWLPGEELNWDEGGAEDRGQKVSQDQSAPYSRDLGSVWDTETVHVSCFFSGQRQNGKRIVTQSRSRQTRSPTPDTPHLPRPSMALPTLIGRQASTTVTGVVTGWTESQADPRREAPCS